MMEMKIVLKSILTVALLSSACALSSARGTKSAAMTFIDGTLTPRVAAMGGISAGLSSDAYAQFGNIAAIPFSDRTFSAGVSYLGWQPSTADVKSGLLGATCRLGRFGISLGAGAFVSNPYETMDAYGNVVGQFTPLNYLVGAGVSYLITDSFSAGLGLHYASSITSAYYDDLYTAYASIQFIYRVKGVSISLSGNNLGLPVTSASGASFNIPMNAGLAVSYSNAWDRHALTAAVDGKAYFGGPFAMGCAVGAEYEYDSMIAVRAGYHYGSRENGLPSYASVGVGVKFFGVNVDAAYLIGSPTSPLRNTFTLGVGYSF